jgi:hypothetical protein
VLSSAGERRAWDGRRVALSSGRRQGGDARQDARARARAAAAQEAERPRGPRGGDRGAEGQAEEVGGEFRAFDSQRSRYFDLICQIWLNGAPPNDFPLAAAGLSCRHQNVLIKRSRSGLLLLIPCVLSKGRVCRA